jgi:hypothetical protein
MGSYDGRGGLASHTRDDLKTLGWPAAQSDRPHLTHNWQFATHSAWDAGHPSAGTLPLVLRLRCGYNAIVFRRRCCGRA